MDSPSDLGMVWQKEPAAQARAGLGRQSRRDENRRINARPEQQDSVQLPRQLRTPALQQ